MQAGIDRKEKEEKKSPGKQGKCNLRGKKKQAGNVRKEKKERKSPGEQRKCNLRGKKTQAGIDRKEKKEMFLEKCKEMK